MSFVPALGNKIPQAAAGAARRQQGDPAAQQSHNYPSFLGNFKAVVFNEGAGQGKGCVVHGLLSNTLCKVPRAPQLWKFPFQITEESGPGRSLY